MTLLLLLLLFLPLPSFSELYTNIFHSVCPLRCVRHCSNDVFKQANTLLCSFDIKIAHCRSGKFIVSTSSLFWVFGIHCNAFSRVKKKFGVDLYAFRYSLHSQCTHSTFNSTSMYSIQYNLIIFLSFILDTIMPFANHKN